MSFRSGLHSLISDQLFLNDQEIAPEPEPPLKSAEPYLPSDLGQLPDQSAMDPLPPILQQQHDVSATMWS